MWRRLHIKKWHLGSILKHEKNLTASVGSWEAVGEGIILGHSNIVRAKRWRREFRAHQKIKTIMVTGRENSDPDYNNTFY